MNLIEAEISSEGLFIEGSRIPLPDKYMKVIEGKKDVVVGIRPEDIYILTKERGDKIRLGLNYKHISIFDKSTQQNLLAIGLK
ncbi:MAG: hypothetical protein F7B61_00875 [Caldisphaeraceae archaeon]|nr:hypothetical protein [Caldisphaeraceae archaeon]